MTPQEETLYQSLLAKLMTLEDCLHDESLFMRSKVAEIKYEVYKLPKLFDMAFTRGELNVLKDLTDED